MAQFLSFLHNFCFLIMVVMVATAECRECEIMPQVEAVLNSITTLTCPVPLYWPDATRIIWEVVEGDKAVLVSDNSKTTQSSLCQKVRTVQEPQAGSSSLIISPVEFNNAAWYQCTFKNSTMELCYKVKLNVKEEPTVQLTACHVGSPLEALLNSTFTQHCPISTFHLQASQYMWGTIEGNQPLPITRCPTPCTSTEVQRPLCERVKTVGASLTINPVVSRDSLWIWCVVNATSCYTFKLTVTDRNQTVTHNQTAEGDSHATQNRLEPTEGGNNVTLVIIILTVCLCTFVALLVGVHILLKKQKRERIQETEEESQYAVYEEFVENNTFQYSLVQFDPARMSSFK